jgi:predicted Zn-ribbon and HTH transcriptional regulator
MARSSRRERLLAYLQCNSCNYSFKDLAWFVSTGGEERGHLEWNQDSTSGARCPSCKSTLIRFRHGRPVEL